MDLPFKSAEAAILSERMDEMVSVDGGSLHKCVKNKDDLTFTLACGVEIAI